MSLVELGYLEGSAGVHALDDLALVRISGDDAASWLNGMVTNDVRSLDALGAVETAIVEVKGKLVAEGFAYALGAERLLAVPAETRQALLAFLDRYVVMEDVTLAAADELALLSVRGPRAAEVVEAAALGTAARVFATDRLGVPGLDVLIERAEREQGLARLLQAAAARGGGALGAEDVEVARLRAGRGRWGHDLDGTAYPQEVGLAPRAVSFQKGCYVGQEVVCTLEMRGHVKRVLARVRLGGDAPATAGAELRRDGEVVGRLTSVARDPVSGEWIGLASLKRAAAEAGAALALDDGRGCEVVAEAR